MNNNILRKFFKNKKVIVTGHTGFKGSWLTLVLIYLGARVVGISNGLCCHVNFVLTKFISFLPKGLPWAEALPDLLGEP